MSDSSVFNTEEWALIRRSPILVFYFVANADDTIDNHEVERLIELFGAPETYDSSVFTQAVTELMSDPADLAKTVAKVLDDDSKNIVSQLAALQQSIDGQLDAKDATAFKEALTRLGIDIAAATGDTELPVSKEEWSELEKFKKLLKHK
jgi:hypothetical protein